MWSSRGHLEISSAASEAAAQCKFSPHAAGVGVQAHRIAESDASLGFTGPGGLARRANDQSQLRRNNAAATGSTALHGLRRFEGRTYQKINFNPAKPNFHPPPAGGSPTTHAQASTTPAAWRQVRGLAAECRDEGWTTWQRGGGIDHTAPASSLGDRRGQLPRRWVGSSDA